MIKAVFFDLDGTFIPMDLKVFTKAYLKEICAVVCPHGISEELFVKSILGGMKAMRANDGKKTNKEVFWETFAAITGLDGEEFVGYADPFYENEFNNTRYCTEGNELARIAVDIAHEKGRKVILATNPFFPKSGQVTRLKWVGLDDCDFDWITSYENEVFCKPNPKYYLAICQRFGFEPSECLMVGNDENDDISPATEAGLNCYLVTDSLIKKEGYTSTCPKGSFAELVEYLRTI